LLIDSAIHSGDSMLRTAEELVKLGVSDIISYSLMIKRASSFIPNYFGVVVDDTDRMYFQLDNIPNNRLIADKKPFGYIRAVRESDIHLPSIKTKVESVNANFGDLVYAAKRGAHVYIYVDEKGAACGYISFTRNGKKIFIDAVVSDEKYSGKHVGTA